MTASESDTPRYCAKCGTALREGSTFCAACGERRAEATPPPAPIPVQPRPRTHAAEGPNGGARAKGVLVAGAGIAAVAAIAATIFVLTRGDDAASSTGTDRQVTEASSPPAPETRTIKLTRHARPLRSTRCFGPGGDAFVRLDGLRRATGILQCGDKSGDKASGGFTVDFGPFTGTRTAVLEGFSAQVGVDEVSRGDTSGPAAFDVTYDGQTVCSATASQGASSICEGSDLQIPIRPGSKLRLEISAPSANTSLSLWAVFVDSQATIVLN